MPSNPPTNATPQLARALARALAQVNEPGSPASAITPAEYNQAHLMIRHLHDREGYDLAPVNLASYAELRAVALQVMADERGEFGPLDLDHQDYDAASKIAGAILDHLRARIQEGYEHQAPTTETPQEPTQSPAHSLTTLDERLTNQIIRDLTNFNHDNHQAQPDQHLPLDHNPARRTWTRAQHLPTHDTPDTPYQDDDQRLGGHDNPHHATEETP